MSMNYNNKDFVENLINQHSTTLVRFLARRMSSREDAEDIAQAAFIRLYTLDDPSKLSNAKAFLFQVAANMSIDQLRRKVLHQNYLEREGAKAPNDGATQVSALVENIPLEREMEARADIDVYLPSSRRAAAKSKAGIYSQSRKRSYLRRDCHADGRLGQLC